MARKRPDSHDPATRRARRRRSALGFFLKWGLVAAAWSVFLGLCFTAWLAYDLPNPSRLNEIKRRPSVTLLAADGAILATYGDLYGRPVALAELPPYLPRAVLATEDRRFYGHFGLDPLGIARAIYVNLREGRLAQGGSTITQQLAKNIFLTPERSIRRKGQELLLALWLEHSFTKDEILALYLNRVYLGAGTYGVEAAARKYFGKPAARVTPYEAAMLAGILKAPSRYNPLSDREAAAARARLALANMVAAGYLGADEATQVAAAAAGESGPTVAGPTGRYFADWVLDQVSSYVGYSERDLVVVTTLDPALQRMAEADLLRLLAEEGADRRVGQAALVAMSPDGAVRAMVGGRDYAESQFNRATQALRQPGSAFKAFVFLAGLEQGLTPDSRLVDSPLSIGGWRPANYEDKYFGEVTLREAFARSLNSVAVQVSQRVGPAAVAATARRLGVTAELSAAPSLALGTSEVSLLELTAAYGVFDNGGYGVWPRGIEEIRDAGGEVLYLRLGSGPDRVVAPRQVAQMLDLLGAVIDWGTGRAAAPGRPAAGKTGTSQDFRDGWFIGFTAELVTGVWVGNDDGRPMGKVSGGALPARLWGSFMRQALAGQPPRPLPEPQPDIAVAEGGGGSIAAWIDRLFEGGDSSSPSLSGQRGNRK
ncbi:MAG TPA: PBP1A family penicillin-binding protein [Dongiaceae bacterium]|nr:PBP1A family penicillin-binding protein [Dongiaceae bacterium]